MAINPWIPSTPKKKDGSLWWTPPPVIEIPAGLEQYEGWGVLILEVERPIRPPLYPALDLYPSVTLYPRND